MYGTRRIHPNPGTTMKIIDKLVSEGRAREISRLIDTQTRAIYYAMRAMAPAEMLLALPEEFDDLPEMAKILVGLEAFRLLNSDTKETTPSFTEEDLRRSLAN